MAAEEGQGGYQLKTAGEEEQGQWAYVNTIAPPPFLCMQAHVLMCTFVCRGLRWVVGTIFDDSSTLGTEAGLIRIISSLLWEALPHLCLPRLVDLTKRAYQKVVLIYIFISLFIGVF